MDIPQGDARYDAATANLGASYKIPTRDQCYELKDGTNYTWTSINGVNGIKLTSKKNSDMYIFLPAGGYWVETIHGNKNGDGRYWTTTWDRSLYAWHATIASGGLGSQTIGTFAGLTVRAISKMLSQFF